MVYQMSLEMSDKPLHITAQQEGEVWRLVGETWLRRRSIAAAGGKWDKDTRSWVFTGEVPESLHYLITKWEGGEQAEETPPAVEQPPVERLAAASEQAAQPGIIKPSYWDMLWLYTTPGRCRPAIALVGPAGNGKTTAAEEVLKLRGVEYLVIDANITMESFDLIGGMSYETKDGTGQQVWKDGPVTRAFREGKGVIINEFDSLDPRTALCLQSALQGKGAKSASRYITLSGNPDEDRVYPAGDCPIILTMNTFGSGATRMYTGRNALDAASRDRLTIINTGYENEKKILEMHGYKRETAWAVMKWADETRRKIDQHELPVILGMRSLLAIAELVDIFGVDIQRAYELEFYQSQEPDIAALLR